MPSCDLPHRLEILIRLGADRPGLFSKLHHLPWYGAMLRQWIDGLPITAGQSVLEVGCGPGLLCHHMAQRGMTVSGIDASAAMIRRARRLCPPESRVSLSQGAVPGLPWAMASFHGVVAASVINVVPNPQSAILDMVRVAAPGGVVSVLFPLPGLSHPEDLCDVLDLRGFSRTALMYWGQKSRKLFMEQVQLWFRQAGGLHITGRTLLHGRVGVVSSRIL